MNEEISKLLLELTDSLQAEDTSLFIIQNAEPDAPLDLVAVCRRTVMEDLSIPHGEGIVDG